MRITRDEILNMPAGREMDALVAEFVMGWLPNPGPAKNSPIQGFFRKGKKHLEWLFMEDIDSMLPKDKIVPHFSIDIAAAWEVVEGLKYNWNLCRDVGKCGSDYETAGDMTYRFIYTAPGMPMEGITAGTAPLAICRAALLVKLAML